MILYALFRTIETILFLFPKPSRKRFFLFLAKIAYRIDSKHRRVILQNLHFALGREFNQHQIDEISQYCYTNLLLAFYQVMENHHDNTQRLEDEISIENRHYVDDALKNGRKIIFVSAHYGNWEMGATALSRLVVPTTAVYKEAKNPHFEHYLLESRTRQGITMVEKRGAVRHLSKALKNNQTISLLVDQNTNQKDGIVVQFFGQSARQSAAASFLARKYNALIIPLLTHNHDDGTYTLKFYEPIEVDQSDESENDILKATQKQADVIEEAIRENPKMWFWCHRRWKTEHPEIYSSS